MRPFLERLGEFLPAATAAALPVVFVPAAPFIPNFPDAFILPRTSLVVAAACLGAGLALVTRPGPALGELRLPLAAAAVAALLAFTFSTSWSLSLAGSYSRYESLPVRLSYLGLLAAPVWLLRSDGWRRATVAAFVAGTTAASLEAVQQWASHAPFRPDGNLGNANLLAALVAMAIPLAVARGVRFDRFAILWWAAVLIMAEGLFASTSRSGALGAVAGCLVLAVLAARRRGTLVVMTGAATLALAGALLAILVTPLRDLNDDPPSLRLHLWGDALRMIAARPLTGWGEDATGLVFGRFLSRDYGSVVTFDRVHTGALEIAATQGLLGLAALASVLVVLGLHVWRSRRLGDVAPLGAALAAYTVWVAFNFDWAPATGAFWLLAGVAWSWVRAPAVPSQAVPAARRPLVSPLGALGFVAATVAFAVLPMLAETWYGRGRADLAVQVDPLQAQYHWAYGQAFVIDGKLAQGIDELRRAGRLGETDPALYVELGDREMQAGRRSDATADFRRALELDPYSGPALERLGQAG